MDPTLKKAIEDLVEAEEGLTYGDPDDWFYACASHVVNVYKALQKGEDAPEPLGQTGFTFSLMPDGSSRINRL